jgi:hypothetical protein
MMLSSLPEYLIQIGFGLVPGVSRVTGLGHNPSIAAVPADVWSGGGTYPWLTAATSLEMVSSSASDAAAGTGTRTVLVAGLDANYVAVSETVTLNGTTPVALLNQYFRINSLIQMSAGSGKVNAGTITLRDSGGGSTRGLIPVIGGQGIGISRQSVYTVPAGFTLQILSQYIGVNGSGATRTVDVSTYIQSSLGYHRLPVVLSAQDGNPYRHDGIPGLTLTEKTDYCLRCTAISSTVELTGAWLGILRKN